MTSSTDLPFPCNLDSMLVQPMGIQPCPVSSGSGWVEQTGNERTDIFTVQAMEVALQVSPFNIIKRMATWRRKSYEVIQFYMSRRLEQKK